MNLIGAVLGSAIGALIGGAIWVAVGYATNYEIGWIAWGVGVAAGLGAVTGSKGQGGPAAGVIAAALAVAAILIAKYVVVQLQVDHYIQTHPINVSKDMPGIDAESYWTSIVADQLVTEKEENGQTIKWPAGKNAENAEFEADYPKDIWADAKKRFKAMSIQAKNDYRDQHAAMIQQAATAYMDSQKSSAYSEGFFATFGLFDIIFGGLAIASAFRLGSGGTALKE